jgi:diguanylate cyclase (GGDEF)-like protein
LWECEVMDNQEARKLQQKVTLLRAEGKYKETIEESYKLLKIGTELRDYKSILTAHISNAASYYSIGAIEEAFQSIEAYTEICDEHGDEADTLNLYNVLFLLYEYNNDYGKAKDTLTKSIQLGQQIEKYNMVSNAYSNYSHICMLEGNFEAALQSAIKGLEMAKVHQPESRILEIRVMLNMAESQIGLSNLEAAGSLIDEITTDSTLESFPREKSQSHILQGNWFAANGRYQEAFESYSKAKELVESYQDVYLLKTIQEERSKACEKMGDLALGYQVQKEYIALLHEINERELAFKALKLDIKHSLSEIKKKATTDYLTGVYNRDYLEMTTNEWLKQASQTGECIACILFDIDNFKLINDEYGHLFGDNVIKQVSQICSTVIRENELFGRYGGDEFMVMLRDATRENAEKRAEQILTTVKKLTIPDYGKEISLSIGVVDNSDSNISSFLDLFDAADQALYKAKRNGKGQVMALD